MRGVVLPGGSRVELRQFPDPQPGIGQVVVRMRYTLEETGEAYRVFDAGETAGKVVVIP